MGATDIVVVFCLSCLEQNVFRTKSAPKTQSMVNDSCLPTKHKTKSADIDLLNVSSASR